MRHAIGRIGCFLVGDDYGRPTDLPWGVAFPEDRRRPTSRSTRHSCTSVPPLSLAWLLVRWRRQGVRDAVVLGRYLMLAGAIRFGIEWVRVNLPKFSAR